MAASSAVYESEEFGPEKFPEIEEILDLLEMIPYTDEDLANLNDEKTVDVFAQFPEQMLGKFLSTRTILVLYNTILKESTLEQIANRIEEIALNRKTLDPIVYPEQLDSTETGEDLQQPTSEVVGSALRCLSDL
ncbi:hypothetical protein L596_011286 [Steinernema carpocapsae]|uniref:Uncharacterized protein n=1 Tax=Steinernema carpocapsae TaxID=34508 RepID=A0A4U5NUD0_STECR|nr:hypothetical protein L596_011286 [Steinernema carpocapsae]